MSEERTAEAVTTNGEQGPRTAISREEAMKMIAEERERRLRACEMAIQRALQEHGCQLVAVAGVSADGRIVASVKLQEAG